MQECVRYRICCYISLVGMVEWSCLVAVLEDQGREMWLSLWQSMGHSHCGSKGSQASRDVVLVNTTPDRHMAGWLAGMTIHLPFCTRPCWDYLLLFAEVRRWKFCCLLTRCVCCIYEPWCMGGCWGAEMYSRQPAPDLSAQHTVGNSRGRQSWQCLVTHSKNRGVKSPLSSSVSLMVYTAAFLINRQ